jgi:hypothetical protein
MPSCFLCLIPLPRSVRIGSGSSGGAGIASGAAVVDAARIAVLEEKVAKLSEELTAELRSKNDTMSQLIKTKLQSEAGDRSLLAKEEEYAASHGFLVAGFSCVMRFHVFPVFLFYDTRSEWWP